MSSADAVTRFFQCYKNRTLDAAPLADDVTYQGPLSPDPIHGRQNVTTFLNHTCLLLVNLRIRRQIHEGDDVAVLWQADTKFGDVQVVYWFRLKEDLISEILSFNDPRAFLEEMGKARTAS
jgi:hypothetical protein